jgi:FkbM family methyltransferase
LTISHAYSNIANYGKKYGLSKAIKAFIHYSYRFFKTKTMSTKNTIVNVHGLKMHVLPNDPIGTSSELLIFNSHEPVSTKIISSKLKKGMTCLDVGANIGYYVLLESKCIGSQGKIIALEPSPINFECLKKNLISLNIGNVQAYNIAAGEKDGITNFLIYEGAGNSCMVIPEGEKPKWPGDIITVPIKRIDSFLEGEGITKIDFLRMDVEGYENKVIEGLQNTIRKSKPIIHLELHLHIVGKDNTSKMLKNLKNEGYEISAYVPRDIDTPLIGTIRDVKLYQINDVLKMIDDNTIPSFVMLTLENSSV